MITGILGALAFTVMLLDVNARASAAAVPRFEPASCSTLMSLRRVIRCGFLVVPENRTKRNGKTIRVAVAIVPAASKKKSPFPLVFLAGAPGATPIFGAKAWADYGFNADRDLILVNQRGVYYSRPQLICPNLDHFFYRQLGLVFDAASTRKAQVAATRECRAQLIAKGIDIAAYNTTENAADFVDLRRVLGYKQWNAYGVSYGTELAVTLMRTDPNGIKSVILDSTVPPNLVNPSAFWPMVRAGFDNFFAACSAQYRCLARYPHLSATFTSLVRTLESHPVTTDIADPVRHQKIAVTTDGGALANWLVSMSLTPDRYPQVPRWIGELAAGKPQHIAASRLTSVVPPGYVGYGLLYGVTCSEWFAFEKHAQVLAAARRMFPKYPASVLAEAPQFTNAADYCRVWNVPKAPAAMRKAVHSTIPTLILSGSFDAVTGKVWADAAAANLPNSRVLVFAGSGHSVATGSKCAQIVMKSFLQHPRDPDVRCVATVKPPIFVAAP